MGVEIWEAALGACGLAASGGIGAIASRRSKGEKDANSAVLLAKAYGELVDDQRASIADARAHIHRQDEEIRGLRNELRSVRDARDTELTALRSELATVREELALERAENGRLRDRLDVIERSASA